MSPAAQMPRTDVSRSAEQATPPLSPSSSPAARASITSGIAPVPITTMSAASSRPEAQTTRSHPRVALEALEPVAADQLDAVLAQQRAEELARRRAEVRRRAARPRASPSCSGARASSASPRPRRRCRSRRPARRARPRARRRGSRRRCRACAGSGSPRAARRRRAGGGRSRRWRCSATPNSTTSLVESVAVRAAVSSRITLVRGASLIERLEYQASSWNRQASRSCGPGQVALRRRRALVGRVGLAADEHHVAAEVALVAAPRRRRRPPRRRRRSARRPQRSATARRSRRTGA